MPRQNTLNWIFGVGIALFIVATPFAYYRWQYAVAKRLRVVTDGTIYRSGCLTADGFEAAIKKYGIRTVLNLQEEDEDPKLPATYTTASRERESELCKRLGVRYEFLQVDLLPPAKVPPNRPVAIEKYFALLDDPKNYPVLVHCKAGLHRTGVLIALYRLEYEGWTVYQALEEMRANGFARAPSYSPNEYIRQYLVNYQPRAKDLPSVAEHLPRIPAEGILRNVSRPVPVRVHGGVLP